MGAGLKGGRHPGFPSTSGDAFLGVRVALRRRSQLLPKAGFAPVLTVAAWDGTATVQRFSVRCRIFHGLWYSATASLRLTQRRFVWQRRAPIVIFKMSAN